MCIRDSHLGVRDVRRELVKRVAHRHAQLAGLDGVVHDVLHLSLIHICGTGIEDGLAVQVVGQRAVRGLELGHEAHVPGIAQRVQGAREQARVARMELGEPRAVERQGQADRLAVHRAPPSAARSIVHRRMAEHPMLMRCV